MANGIVKWFREKLNLIGLRFWMFREIRMWKVRGDLIVWGMLLQWLVKRRHTHVGAPDNRIEGLYLKSMS